MWETSRMSICIHRQRRKGFGFRIFSSHLISPRFRRTRRKKRNSASTLYSLVVKLWTISYRSSFPILNDMVSKEENQCYQHLMHYLKLLVVVRLSYLSFLLYTILRHLDGIQHIVLGMPHRGRLNFLTDVLQYSPTALFHKIKGGGEIPESLGAQGDVISHLGPFSLRRLILLASLLTPYYIKLLPPLSNTKTQLIQSKYLYFQTPLISRQSVRSHLAKLARSNIRC